MSISVGSGSDALSYIQSLLQSVTNLAGNAAGVGPVGDWLASAGNGATQTAGGGASTGTQAFGMAPPPFQDGTMAALIALKGQDTSGGGAQGLLAKIDTDGDGKVSQSEFETALGSSGVDKSNADAMFSTLDHDGDGSVDQNELSSALRRGGGHGHHHRMAAGGSGGGPDGLSSLLDATGADGAKTETATNSDGSTTTTITYNDGSTVTMTTPAQAGGSSSDGTSSTQAANKSPINLIEQLIKMQTQLVNQQGATVSAVA